MVYPGAVYRTIDHRQQRHASEPPYQTDTNHVTPHSHTNQRQHDQSAGYSCAEQSNSSSSTQACSTTLHSAAVDASLVTSGSRWRDEMKMRSQQRRLPSSFSISQQCSPNKRHLGDTMRCHTRRIVWHVACHGNRHLRSARCGQLWRLRLACVHTVRSLWRMPHGAAHPECPAP